MATITAVRPFDAVAAAPLAPIALGLTNTLTYVSTAKGILFVRNGSGASVTATLDGSLAPASVAVPGTGATLNTAPGAVFTIAAGTILAIPLANYRAFLKGSVTLVLSLATSVDAWLIEV